MVTVFVLSLINCIDGIEFRKDGKIGFKAKPGVVFCFRRNRRLKESECGGDFRSTRVRRLHMCFIPGMEHAH
jgi:hypothetical protein